MDFSILETLKRTHPGWRLLAADHAPMTIGFLHAAFIEPNVRSISQPALVSALDDWLYQLRQQSSSDAYPRSGSQYLDTWADDQHAWLRKYYLPNDDEPWFDLTPATEKAIAWIMSLKHRVFIGTESRLMMVFELLRQMTEGTELDPAARIAELEKRRAQIDAEIQAVRAGNLSVMDSAQIKDRFQQVVATARGLLSDFREVDQNFRDLDRAIREKMATWDGSKGALLDEVFGERDAIRDSDQGVSFRAFWDFLMSPERQEQLSNMLEKVFALPVVRELEADRRFLRIHYDWLAAGEVTQRTIARVSGQLRRYLDDQAWLEHRRIMQLIRQIEQHALALRGTALGDLGHFVEEAAPAIELPFERPLYTPPYKPSITDRIAAPGLDEAIPTDALYEQVYVDKVRLSDNVRKALQRRAQVSLAELLEQYPLDQGLAEVISYLSLAADDNKALIDDQRRQTLVWSDPERGPRQATVPLVVFTR